MSIPVIIISCENVFRTSTNESDIVLSLQLSLTDKQRSKLPKSAKIVLFPFPFKEPRRILAIVPEPMIDQTREDFGADIVGSEAIIPEILDDTYEVDIDFDVIIAHMELSKEITGLRKKLEKLYPIKGKRTLGDDIENMIQHHKYGQFYLYSHAEPVFETEVGTTEMPVEKIEENIFTMVERIESDCKLLVPKEKLIVDCCLNCFELLPQYVQLDSLRK